MQMVGVRYTKSKKLKDDEIVMVVETEKKIVYYCVNVVDRRLFEINMLELYSIPVSVYPFYWGMREWLKRADCKSVG